MSTPKHDDKMHPNRYERAPDERSIYKRYEDANKEIEQLQRELQDKRAIIGSQLTFINELRATADRDEQEQKL